MGKLSASSLTMFVTYFFILFSALFSFAQVTRITPEVQNLSQEQVYSGTCVKAFKLPLAEEGTQLKCLLSEPCQTQFQKGARPVWFLQGLAGVGKAYEHWLRFFAKRGHPAFTCDIPGVNYSAYKPFRKAWYSFGSSSLALWWMIRDGEKRFLDGYLTLQKIVPLIQEKVLSQFSYPVHNPDGSLILAGHSLGSIYSLAFAGVLAHKNYEKATFPIESMVLLSPPAYGQGGFSQGAFQQITQPVVFISGSQDDAEERLKGFFHIASSKAMLVNFRGVHHLSFSVNPRKKRVWNPHIGKIMGSVAFFLEDSERYQKHDKLTYDAALFTETVYGKKD